MPKGYAIHDTKNWTDFKVIDFELKTPEDDDVEVSITHCGICGSDLHTISGGWGPLSVPACIPGHEIVGHVTQVGKNVKDIKVGDRVGIGAQVGSCMNCHPCKHDNENYCIGDGKGHMVDTYNSHWPDGSIAQGGYSTAIRAHQQFVFPIPEGLKSEHAAPMLCAGLTVYSPLFRNKVGPGMRVAIVGIGGLGHFGVMFAKAMGADVVAISHSASKEKDALKMGATKFVSTKEDPNWAEHFKNEPFDLIINTASSSAVDVPGMISSLKTDGRLICVGMPEDEIRVRVQHLAMRSALLGSSHIGNKTEALSMLKLAAEKNIEPWIELVDMKDCSKAMERVSKGDIRYRFVLKQDLA
ncbi:Similar to S.cerevisiae protein ADH6 (NADPH-dependent medium chain alcohol dehydrogenase) [Malassezia sympodialis ATCC 42132]|uniref:alcohol dehydrogenase (NADP(+)) n=1 Tax=Malassezia sympodialis (strain ATCC 42132) TaxID=1230383 RepID=A0A1M8A0L7_MALS4|nr:Similar to S.cerevisiae protein ADH6 (NADPH-dependent medium chain alcohol dehydrogenase) [Malassezia sympodialis ATCC 42132]